MFDRRMPFDCRACGYRGDVPLPKLLNIAGYTISCPNCGTKSENRPILSRAALSVLTVFAGFFLIHWIISELRPNWTHGDGTMIAVLILLPIAIAFRPKLMSWTRTWVVQGGS
jgi:predicted RNA-binding Zn-ribbon protein involved in translation (DUF1610 family)